MVHVTSVTAVSTEADFHFDQPVGTDGSSSGLVSINTGVDVFGALASASVSANIVRYQFDPDVVAAGETWRIDGVPPELQLPPGAGFPVPQVGTVA
jgi:hypothetical protein